VEPAGDGDLVRSRRAFLVGPGCAGLVGVQATTTDPLRGRGLCYTCPVSEERFSSLRREYVGAELAEAAVLADPLAQFDRWFEEAREAEPMANAMTLATVDPAGQPAARIVLLKGIEEGGFVFYTNYESRKGIELAANPRAALLFFWSTLDRQVRIQGRVTRVPAERSDSYFHARPRASNLSALASPQSRVVSGRAVLEARVAELAEAFAGRELTRPPQWGGYSLRPEAVEFWQGRPDRLHDRIEYVRGADGGWRIQRLAP
jgi:pyridoxamine 5'-phosphate oxidase